MVYYGKHGKSVLLERKERCTRGRNQGGQLVAESQRIQLRREAKTEAPQRGASAAPADSHTESRTHVHPAAPRVLALLLFVCALPGCMELRPNS